MSDEQAREEEAREETNSMAICYYELRDFDEPTQQRMLAWLKARLDSERDKPDKSRSP